MTIGGRFANIHEDMNVIWQDVKVASLHAGLNFNTAIESYVRALCGHHTLLSIASQIAKMRCKSSLAF